MLLCHLFLSEQATPHHGLHIAVTLPLYADLTGAPCFSSPLCTFWILLLYPVQVSILGKLSIHTWAPTLLIKEADSDREKAP